MFKKITNLAVLGRGLRHLTILAAMAWAGNAYSADISTTIYNVTDLKAGFAVADANPTNTYTFTLANPNLNPDPNYSWGVVPASGITLTKGQVTVIGSRTNPEYFDFNGNGNRPFALSAGTTNDKPRLKLVGITVRNGASSNNGGGLFASNFDSLQILSSRFINNKSELLGSGIFAQNGREVIIENTLVDGNEYKYLTTNCGGGGMTASGGGISLYSDPTKTPMTFTLKSSTISNNKACRGGGLNFGGKLTSSLTNNTISGNVAMIRGGGILWRDDSGNHFLKFNTIAFNQAGLNPSYTSESKYGGGVAFSNFSGNMNAYGNVVAKNTLYSTPVVSDCFMENSASARNPSPPIGNFIGNKSNCHQFGNSGWGVGPGYGKPSDSTLEPSLGPLMVQTPALHPTYQPFMQKLPVHMPQLNSPLRNNFINTNYGSCHLIDQRYFFRSSGGELFCDIGSVDSSNSLTPPSY